MQLIGYDGARSTWFFARSTWFLVPVAPNVDAEPRDEACQGARLDPSLEAAANFRGFQPPSTSVPEGGRRLGGSSITVFVMTSERDGI